MTIHDLRRVVSSKKLKVEIGSSAQKRVKQLLWYIINGQKYQIAMGLWQSAVHSLRNVVMRKSSVSF